MNSSSNPSAWLPMRQTHPLRATIPVGPASILLYGVLEQRSEIDPSWLKLFAEQNTFEVLSRDDLFSAKVPRYGEAWLSVRDQKQLREFVTSLNASSVYIDITGLPHHVWMPLVRVCVEEGKETCCIYVEPISYAHNVTPKPGEFFDLSERIQGFSPIPTFARLQAKRSEETILIPLLGFEGIRFRHLIERIEPSERDISPIIGVPGFELEYPFHTFEGNATVLREPLNSAIHQRRPRRFPPFSAD